VRDADAVIGIGEGVVQECVDDDGTTITTITTTTQFTPFLT
jgi:hypothetical protein